MSKQEVWKKLFMASAMLAFNPGKPQRKYRVGDTIQFYPQIVIDKYKAAATAEPYLKHVIYDIYEFSFVPIDKFFNNTHDDCYHYLIEIFPDFKLFCFNWTKLYKDYLAVGQRYEGYGQLRNCGDAAADNHFIPPSVMSGIYRTGKLAGITENLLWSDFGKDKTKMRKPARYGEDIYCYEDVLDGFGYDRNMEEFKTKTSVYKKMSVQHENNETPDVTSNLIFCIDLF